MLILRVVNVLLSTANLLILIWTIHDWKRRSSGNRFLWSGLGLLLFTTGYGTAEALVQRTSGGFRVALTTVALIYVLGGLVSKARGGWTEDAVEQERHR